MTKYIRVIITKDLPQIIGADLKTYGPFSDGDEVVEEHQIPTFRCQDCGVILLEGQQRIFYGRRATLILCDPCQKTRLKRRDLKQVSLLAFQETSY